MQVLVSIAFVGLLGLAWASLAELQDRTEVPRTPVVVAYLSEHRSKRFWCGENEYQINDIYLAIQHAVSLEEIHETRGRQQYPHAFYGRGDEFIPLPVSCPADPDRKLYPLKHQHPYDGNSRKTNHGLERVIYYREGGEVDAASGHPKAYFCAVVTHHMAGRGKFKKCYVPAPERTSSQA